MATNRKRQVHKASTASRKVDRSNDVNVRIARRLWPFVQARAEQVGKPCAWVVEQAIQNDLGLDDRSGIVDTPDLNEGVTDGTSSDAQTREPVLVPRTEGGSAGAVPGDSDGGAAVRSGDRGQHAEERGPDGRDPFAPGVRDDGERLDRARGAGFLSGVSGGPGVPDVPVLRPVEQDGAGHSERPVSDQPAVAAGPVAESAADRLVRPAPGVDSGIDPELGF